MIDVRAAAPGDLPAAVEVWHAANIARGLPPTSQRLARIREKLTAPDATFLVATLPASANTPPFTVPVAPPAAGAARAVSSASGVVPTAGMVPAVASCVVPVVASGVPPVLSEVSGAGIEVLVGMALVEPGRAGDGAGELIPGHGHVSMVFVHPSHWSHGYGRHLLHAIHALGWTRTTLWTRRSNNRAQRLYLAAGYTPTGRTARLPDGDAIIHLERHPTPQPL